MRIAKRLFARIALPMALGFTIMQPASGAGLLQCVPYARELSGVSIHGDAWTWWEQAKGRYLRGYEPKPGAVLALANSDVMPLGHVAVVSKILDERHILVRHANWSAPGLIERDVMAVDSSAQNDWSQVRIWWGQGQQMGARDNPVNGFIYPTRIADRAVLDPDEIEPSRKIEIAALPQRRFLSAMGADRGAGANRPHLAIDPGLFRTTRDTGPSMGSPERTLAMVIRDVRREARLR
ncbi:MAG TPA: CHAP domain-containing protein [Sphingobium sp.]